MCLLAAADPFTRRAGFFFRRVTFLLRVVVRRRGFAFAFVRLFFLVTRFLAVAISARVAIVIAKASGLGSCGVKFPLQMPFLDHLVPPLL